MINYVSGFLITFITIIMFQLLGMCVSKKKDHDSYSFLLGFVIYSTLVFIGGLPIQLLHLPWKVFFIYMLVLWLGILLYIVYHIYKKYICLDKQTIILYIKRNWFLYVGAFLILLIALGHIQTIWVNNLTDDSFYLNKMATIPYIDQPFQTDPTTGFYDPQFNTYLLNTFELEGSFYIYISGLSGTLYARFFLALLNYFILLNIMRAFLFKVNNLMNINIPEALFSYICVPLFLLFIMNSTSFIYSHESWTVTSAAYFGSALVRIGCPFLCLLELMDKDRLDSKRFLFTILVCLVMVSKSTIAFPILFLCAIGYLLTLKGKYHLFLKAALIISLLVLGYLLPDNPKIYEHILDLIAGNLLKPVVLAAVVCLCVFSYHVPIYRRFFVILLAAFAFMLIPYLNRSFFIIANYTFVVDRTVYSLLIFLIIISVSGVIMMLIKHFTIYKSLIVCSLLSIIMIISGTVAFGWNDVKALTAAKIYYRNPDIVPDMTKRLGETLEAYYMDKKIQPTVLMSIGVLGSYYNNSHTPAAILRTFAPHAQSLGAGIRTSAIYHNCYSDFDGFSIDDMNVFNDFTTTPNQEHADELMIINDKYPFNCIVGLNYQQTHTDLLEANGYYVYKILNDPYQNYSYTIYMRN